MRRSRIIVLLATLSAAALLLGACSSGGGTEEVDETPDESSAAPDEAAAGGGSGPDCVQGSWVSDAEAQAAAAESAFANAEFGADATVTGDFRTTIDGSSMTTEYHDLVLEIALDMPGQALTVVTTSTGTITGTIELTDTQLVISDVDDSGFQLDYQTLVNGEPVSMPGFDESVTDFNTGGTSTYTCSGDELRITPVVEGVDTTNVVTVLHRT